MARDNSRLVARERSVARAELQDRFLTDLLEIYAERGREWLETAAERDPTMALKLVAQLMPSTTDRQTGPSRSPEDRRRRLAELSERLGYATPPELAELAPAIAPAVDPLPNPAPQPIAPAVARQTRKRRVTPVDPFP